MDRQPRHLLGPAGREHSDCEHSDCEDSDRENSDRENSDREHSDRENTERSEVSEDQRFSGLSEAIGSNLAARRVELGKSLRSTAVDANVSPSHLSDIENGRSQVSLPVLLRLVRALDLTVGELLPRIGGNQSTEGSINYLDESITSLCHPDLELTIEHRNFDPEQSVTIENNHLDDLFVHVLDGEVAVTAAGERHVLTTGDSLDSERLPLLEIHAVQQTKLLLTTGARTP